MVRFELNTSKVRLKLDLRDKYILIDGFSGKGKSLFVAEAEKALRSETGELKSDVKCIVVSNSANLEVIDIMVSKYGCVIFIVDEFYAYRVIESISGLNAYCIAVTRKIYSNINMSYRSLYTIDRDEDGITVIKPKFKINRIGECTRFEYVFTEDASAGYELVKEFINNKSTVISTGGNGSISGVLRKYRDAKSWLLICDGGGLACVANKIRREFNVAKKRGCIARICLPECFEHVLLSSEFIGLDKDIFKYFDLKYDNTEKFCEERIFDLTKGRPYEFSHEKQILKECWYKDCDLCDSKCSFAKLGDKKCIVLSNGPLAGLLKLESLK